MQKEATKSAAVNFLQQQARFDTFLDVFNNERPHEALNMKCPAEVSRPSPRPYTGLPDLEYPLHDKTIVVTRCGRICLGKQKTNFSQVLRDKRSASKKCRMTSGWSVSWTVTWATSIWRHECSSRSKIRSARKCYLCLRYKVSPMSPGWTPGMGGGP